MVHQIKILQICKFPGCSPFSADPVTQTSLSQSCRQKMVQEVKVVTMVAFISLCFLASEHFSVLMFSLIVIKRLKSPPLTYLCRHRVAGSWISQSTLGGCFALTTVLEVSWLSYTHIDFSTDLFTARVGWNERSIKTRICSFYLMIHAVLMTEGVRTVDAVCIYMCRLDFKKKRRRRRKVSTASFLNLLCCLTYLALHHFLSTEGAVALMKYLWRFIIIGSLVDEE